jgi:hypothetical protein
MITGYHIFLPWKHTLLSENKYSRCKLKELTLIFSVTKNEKETVKSNDSDTTISELKSILGLILLNPRLSFVCSLRVPWGDNFNAFNPRMPCQWYVRGGGEGKWRILIGQSVHPTPFGMAFGRLKLSPLRYSIALECETLHHFVQKKLKHVGSLCTVRQY